MGGRLGFLATLAAAAVLWMSPAKAQDAGLPPVDDPEPTVTIKHNGNTVKSLDRQLPGVDTLPSVPQSIPKKTSPLPRKYVPTPRTAFDDAHGFDLHLLGGGEGPYLFGLGRARWFREDWRADFIDRYTELGPTDVTEKSICNEWEAELQLSDFIRLNAAQYGRESWLPEISDSTSEGPYEIDTLTRSKEFEDCLAFGGRFVIPTGELRWLAAGRYEERTFTNESTTDITVTDTNDPAGSYTDTVESSTDIELFRRSLLLGLDMPMSRNHRGRIFLTFDNTSVEGEQENEYALILAAGGKFRGNLDFRNVHYDIAGGKVFVDDSERGFRGDIGSLTMSAEIGLSDTAISASAFKGQNSQMYGGAFLYSQDLSATHVEALQMLHNTRALSALGLTPERGDLLHDAALENQGLDLVMRLPSTWDPKKARWALLLSGFGGEVDDNPCQEYSVALLLPAGDKVLSPGFQYEDMDGSVTQGASVQVMGRKGFFKVLYQHSDDSDGISIGGGVRF